MSESTGEKTIGSGRQASVLSIQWINKDEYERASTADPTCKASIFARTLCENSVGIFRQRQRPQGRCTRATRQAR